MSDGPFSDIAIIGMAGRFPGARNPHDFWRNVRDGVESVSSLSDQELLAAGVSPEVLSNPDYVRRAAILEDFDTFDAGLFGFSPKDAAIMDPQHRQFLECAWEAIENAGHVLDGGSVGVFAGCGMNAYFIFNLLRNKKLMNSTGLFLVRHTGNDKDFLATRVSYNLDLRGPSVNVQTACSTSLTAIHLACQSLLNGECDFALAGGVTIEIPHAHGYLYQDGEILSRDGHCRSFDAAASGTVFGSGVGVVLLRRCEEAIQAGDTIHAVIKSSAINNDGSSKVGYLAPSVDGQAAVVAEALGIAGLSADSIGYVATHGTATPVGDPIEIAALTQAFRRSTSRKQFCAVTSVKSNIGHLDTAAGVASLVQTVEALKHKQIPPSLHFTTPNPLIDFPNTPFYVNAQLQEWKTNGAPRRAAVSSLGVGGTNAHVILEEAPELPPTDPGRGAHLFTLSAHTPKSLEGATERLSAFWQNNPTVTLADAAYTTNTGRKQLQHRRIIVCSDALEGALAISSADTRRLFTAQVKTTKAPSVAFMFPGGGAQHPNMGLELYREEPVYRDAVDRCFALLDAGFRSRLREAMFPTPGQFEAAVQALEGPALGLPALFIVEYALAQLWISWGVRPSVAIGHSVGAYAAACITNIMLLEDALSIVLLRGRLFASLPEGAMVSVPLPEVELQPLLNDGLSIAAINTRGYCTVSGKLPAVVELESELAARGIGFQRLHISVAAHSPVVEPILEEFAEGVRKLRLHAPDIQCVSCLTGSFMTPEQARDPNLWVRKLRETVRFSDGVELLFRDRNTLLLEVGPGQSLTSLVRQHPARPAGQAVCASLPRPQEQFPDRQHILQTLGRLWCHGVAVDWNAFYANERRRRIPLPTYAFEHARYWIDADEPVDQPQTGAQAALIRKKDVATWFAQPQWAPAELTASAPNAGSKLTWLVFDEGNGFGARCIQTLSSAGHTVVVARIGSQFAATDENTFTVRPDTKTDYDSLFQAVRQTLTIDRILHLWAVEDVRAEPKPIEDTLNRSFYSLLHLTQSMATGGVNDNVHVGVVSNNLYGVGGSAMFAPERSVLLGPCRVVPAENPDTTWQNIDIDLPAGGGPEDDFVVNAVIQEALAAPTVTNVAYRDRRRYTQRLEPVRLGGNKGRVRENGVYIITGGLGGIALVQAEFLAREAKATLVLLHRSPFPSRHEWNAWISEHDSQNATSTTIRALWNLEQLGAKVIPVRADVTNLEEMSAVLTQVQQQAGPIQGIVHAAGVLEDGVAQWKTRDSAERVLAPKLMGTLVLDKLLGNQPLDFFVVFSSISSLIGLPGQIDYAAANAFLDVFAQKRAAEGLAAISINWGVWREVGLAARLMAPPHQSDARASLPAGANPLVGVCTVQTDSDRVYQATYDSEALWVLSEHKLKNGSAVLPGSAYVELAASAAGDSSLTCEIRNLTFLTRLEIEPGHANREARIEFKRRGASSFDFVFASKELSDPGAEWIEHATADVIALDKHPGRRDVAPLVQRCRPQPQTAQCGSQGDYVAFGPRWHCIQSADIGTEDAVAVLELSSDFIQDCATFRLHPAILDIATSFALPMIQKHNPQTGLYVPLSYRSIRVYGPLPAKIISHVRLHSRTDSQTGFAVFDATLLDTEGNILLEADEFTMKAVEPVATTTTAVAVSQTVPARTSMRSKPANAASANPLLEQWISNGITPPEGIEAFRRILTADQPQVIVSPLDVTSLVAATKPARTSAAPRSQQTHVQAVVASSGNPIEGFLIDTWKDLLGVDHVDINDDFFDLGGHSLVAVRLFTKIRKAYNVDFGLATLFEARTVRQLAALLTKPLEPRSFSSLVPVQAAGTKPPLHMIHGIGGNIIGFDALVKRLGPNQPVYALQSQGLDGIRPHLTTIEEMAAHYISEIRVVQPRGPYYLLGYSFGGLVAFEMAQQLQTSGEEVGLLGMLDSFQLTYLQAKSKLSSEAFARYKDKLVAHTRAVLFGPNRRLYIQDGLRRQYNHLFRKLARGGGEAPVPGPFSIIHMANEVAGRNYRPLPYSGKITMFRAQIRPPFEQYDRTLGWTGLASEIEVIDVPGDHISMGEEPNAAMLAAALDRCMSQTVAVLNVLTTSAGQ